MASERVHTYTTETVWTGNAGEGTRTYRAFDRLADTTAPGRPVLPASADPGVSVRADGARWNPELLLLASLSQCHLLWYLHFCSVNGVEVTAYRDPAEAFMAEEGAKGGRFTRAVLRPRVEVADESMTERALALHKQAREACYIANSVNFPVDHEPAVTVRRPAA
ncbi:OsmC family protein [Streptomyces aidingensis]|uniref:Organic hydroperoxide reductase OsmC/OhrA n=1 Tax=Streptomyces aidingensis TaxID=910347 RepID=A0A1I1R064_9ACTN|nr:OsmC family protein [Streptomyces aidingensis]SFD27695.1 Organic hydroperoxide reductase OsmC/OhrA [Streptomyces aidingensis]